MRTKGNSPTDNFKELKIRIVKKPNPFCLPPTIPQIRMLMELLEPTNATFLSPNVVEMSTVPDMKFGKQRFIASQGTREPARRKELAGFQIGLWEGLLWAIQGGGED